MKIALVSDVHSNYEALRSVLSEIRAQRIERIICLGDLVGYCCLPQQTLELLRQYGVWSIQGNHDLMAIGRLEPVQCGPNARTAILWTRTVLTKVERDYLASLPPQAVVDSELLCLHSCLNDPVSYLRRPEDYAAQYLVLRDAYPDVWICLTGHTHIAGVIEICGTQIRSYRQSTITLVRGRFYFVNPGSVGHPRDADTRASYALYDDQTRTVTFHRVAYDHIAVATENARHGIYTNLDVSRDARARFPFKQFTKGWR